MESDPVQVAPAPSYPAGRVRQRQQQLAQRDHAVRSQTVRQGRTPRAQKLRRTTQKAAWDFESTHHISSGSPLPYRSATVKPLSPTVTQTASLFPLAERRSQEEKLPYQKPSKAGQDDSKSDITPDGGSAGREGRQFAVWNVGNNGRIYLRPSVRPPHQRYPQPNFVFPMTPPGTAGLESLTLTAENTSSGFTQTRLTPSRLPSTPTTTYMSERDAFPRIRHRRAMSDSTVPDTSIARESDVGGFKIVITQPGDEQRPRTVEDMDLARPPLLEISIPSWKLGTPRFSVRGTPFLRGSSYAPTEDVRSSSASALNHTPRELTPGLSMTRPSQLFTTRSQISPRLPPPFGSSYLSTSPSIEPAMFDGLTFKPACDDRSIVRYSQSSGAVTAATPPRLVAEITSPTFLDYDLLSDFFLTFRTFLDSTDLLRMLVARLRWALSQGDRELGTVVRVRTFVAIRHWILNYFLDDFVVDYELRVAFCDLVNDFMDELSHDPDANKAWLKILAELKRCWRRVCAQYWDGLEFDASLASDQHISPGGLAGQRDPNVDASIWERAETRPPQLDGVLVDSRVRDNRGSLYGEVLRVGHPAAAVANERPATPETDKYDVLERTQTSPMSITSVDVISCSFPTKSMRMAQPGSQPLAPHPVDPSSVLANADSIATTPRALMGKRVRPQHKRNGSLSDSLREPATTTERLLYKNTEFILSLPYAGSLVRGNLMPPAHAFVEIAPVSDTRGPHRETTVFEQSPTESQKFKLPASAMSGQGMRRLLGSVRRALSTRGEATSPTQGNFFNISPIGPRGATMNRLPGTAIVPQARPRTNGIRPPIRIDLLGAEIAEDFKRAVREDAATEAEKHNDTLTESSATPKAGAVGGLDHLAVPMGTDPDCRPTSDMAITTGSKSIVIVDDTLALDYPVMRGALPASNASVEAFAESFMHNVADPTPPTTPPGRPTDTPRRSSYILGQPVIRPSLSADPLPPFIPDMKTLGPGASSDRPSQDTMRSSIDIPRQSPRRPPLSGRKGHLRHRSSRSLRTNGSQHRLRHASITSGIRPARPVIQSFDATTYSEGSVGDVSDDAVPQPLRVLRRRPGGDLRAVNKVGDLDAGPLRKSRSVGSLSTFTDSIQSSYIHTVDPDSSGFVDVGSSDFSRDGAKTFSLGAIAEQKPKRELSLFSTHSSKPIMRPSFEAEAQKLAQIPDNPEDEGGVEAALLKLEGKYEKKSVVSFVGSKTRPVANLEQPGDGAANQADASREEKLDHRHVQVEDEFLLSPPRPPSATPGHGQNSLVVPSVQKSDNDGQSFLSDDSHVSYSSIPLLERGLTDEARSRRTATQEWTNRSILQGPEEETPTPLERNPLDSQHPSYDFVRKTDSLERIAPGQTVPAESDPRQSTEQSFLDVESDNDTDLSSEMSLEFVGSNDDDDFFPSAKHTAPGGNLPLDCQTDNSAAAKLQPDLTEATPSPPITLAQALEMGPSNMLKIPMVHEHQLWGEKPLPPTPDTTPTSIAAPYSIGQTSENDPTGTKEALRNAPTLDIPDPVPRLADPPRNKYSVHLPFILAFDSEVLAQQFTLVEKDALNEIDWKDLIDMKWKNAEQKGTNTRSWVSFLRDTDARGVEVVIARFNIMVKWAVSECVLTQDLEERARCIIKYIHIAGHCRRYRNYATASQLTIALTSPEVSRLTKTWALVPPSDIKTLRDLEALISPTRNFYNLRREMEGGGSAGAASTDIGCIPFVGIYTHDLLFNAQRPSEIASSPTTAPLVNFERCRMAAGVVKTLLRLLEASTNYPFQPIEGVTERCLWMGALSDEEIRKLADTLE